jgi:transcriptional regulator with XRE-family HTH domain
MRKRTARTVSSSREHEQGCGAAMRVPAVRYPQPVRVWKDSACPHSGHPAGTFISYVVSYYAGTRNTTLCEAVRILPGVSSTFGDRLRTLRTRRRLTPSALAHAVGVTEGAIRQMESGQTKSASFLVGLRLARLLEVTPWYLATGADEDANPTATAADASLIGAVEALTLQLHAIDRRLRTLEAHARPAAKRRRGAD